MNAIDKKTADTTTEALPSRRTVLGAGGAARFVAKESAGTVKHGDGLLGIEAVVNSPVGLSLDSQGYLYICERGENKIRRVKLW